MSETELHQDLPERWSSGRKTEIVLRLLRGEDLGTVSRKIQVPPQEVEDWRWVFLDGGTRDLRILGGLAKTWRNP